MKQYIKAGGKILYDYAMALIVFVVFMYPFLAFTKDKFYTWLPLYSIIIFLFAFYIIYGEMKVLAIKEKRPQYDLHPYPMKGLLYGIFAIIPIATISGTLSLLRLESGIADRIRHVAINTLLGPVYFIIRWMKESFVGYVIAILVIPVLAMLGYLAGYYEIDIYRSVFKKKNTVQEKKFTKSPWNPTIAQNEKTGKKKRDPENQ